MSVFVNRNFLREKSVEGGIEIFYLRVSHRKNIKCILFTQKFISLQLKYKDFVKSIFPLPIREENTDFTILYRQNQFRLLSITCI